MNSLNHTITLNNGVKIPAFGFGTWSLTGAEGADLIEQAIRMGYRLIDTAYGYGNEDSVSIAVKNSGVPRQELFIISKLDNNYHGYDKTFEAFELTMKNLNMDYLDLYLIHWPNPLPLRDCWEEFNAGSWRAFEELYKAGRIKAIGISNFLPHHIDALMKTVKITPTVNQMRICPGDDGKLQDDVTNYCKKLGIQMIAYSPLGNGGKIQEVPLMKQLAEKYNKNINQIALRWNLQRGFIPIPRTKNTMRIKSNADVFGFALSEEDMELLNNIPIDYCGEAPHPDTRPW